MARGVLFTGGKGPESGFVRKIVHSDDMICAADSGLEKALDADLAVDGMVGDMDSLPDKALLDLCRPEVVEKYPKDKDLSDTEIGMEWLKSRGCSEILLIGGGEGRLDHTLALVSRYKRAFCPRLWYTAREEIYLLENENTQFEGCPGGQVSFFPVGGGPWDVRSRGLQWELDKVDWAAGAVSLSNRIIGRPVELQARLGRFLMIRPIEESLSGSGGFLCSGVC